MDANKNDREANTPADSSDAGPPAPIKREGDQIQKIMGAEYGRWQCWIFVLIFFNKMATGLHPFSIVFLSSPSKYICPDTNKMTCPCPNPIWDHSVSKNTIIMEWNLICDKKKFQSYNQAFFQTGVLFGSLFFGAMSDRYGRRKAILGTIGLNLVSGFVAPSMGNFWMFNILRMLTGCSIGGMMVTGFVLLMEYVGTKYRDVMSAVFQMPFSFGHMSTAFFGYFFRDYKSFSYSIMIPSVILTCYVCVLPESARWLLAVGKVDEATAILTKVAKVNNRPTDTVRAEVDAYMLTSTKSKKGTVYDLFRTPIIRRNILIMSSQWFNVGYTFYGVSQYMSHVAGNIFFNIALSAFFCLIGCCLAIPLMNYVSRRNSMIGMNLFCATCLLMIAVTKNKYVDLICGILGAMSSFMLYILVYLYCSEMFPTVIRSNALGFASMIARIGSIISPFVLSTVETNRALPPTMYAISPLVAAISSYFLPETKNIPMITTLEEGEKLTRNYKPER